MFFSVQACFYCIVSVVEIVVMLKNKDAANQMQSRWFCTVAHNLTVLFCSAINF